MMQVKDGFYKRKHAEMRLVILLLALVLISVFVSMMFGKTFYSLSEILDVLLGHSQHGTFTIKTLRLPRVLAGLLCGMAFGVAGNTFQRILGNPLASPDIIGISSGSAVAAVFTILILHWSGPKVSIAALVCGMIVATIIYGLAHGKHFNSARLILVGIGAQAFLNALISWLLLVSSQYDVANALRWLSGSLNGVQLSDIPLLAFVVLIVMVFILILDQHLNILQLGEEFAQTLGSNPQRYRFVFIVLALFLSAFATSVSGPIASVSFLSGPIARKISKGRGNHMISSALIGALLVLVGDFIGQYALPARYPVGVITGIVGAPYLLFLLLRMNKRG